MIIEQVTLHPSDAHQAIKQLKAWGCKVDGHRKKINEIHQAYPVMWLALLDTSSFEKFIIAEIEDEIPSLWDGLKVITNPDVRAYHAVVVGFSHINDAVHLALKIV